MSAMTAVRPSEARRNALKVADAEGGGNGVPMVSNFFPIDRYYNAAEKLYEAVGKAFEERRLDDAYIYGLRFAAFSVEGLPRHDYYKSKKYEVQRRRNTILVKEVLTKVEAVVRLMDEEELAKQLELQRRHEEAIQREEEKERQRYDALQDRIQKLKENNNNKRRSATPDRNQVESSALSKLELLRRPEAVPHKPSTPTSRHSGSARDDSRSRTGRRGSFNEQQPHPELSRCASGSSDDDDRRRPSLTHSPTPPLYNEDNNASAKPSRGSRRSSTPNYPSSSDDETNGNSNNMNVASSRRSTRPPSSSNHNKNYSSERSLSIQSSSNHSNGHHHHKYRSKSPSILNDHDQSSGHNSWSQASDPKDAWKLENDDAEPVSSRFREHISSNRHGPTFNNGGATSNGSSGLMPKGGDLPPPLLPPPPPSYNQVVSTIKSDASVASTTSSRFRANQYFGPTTVNNSTGPDVGVSWPFAAPAGGARREPSVIMPQPPPPMSRGSSSSVNGFQVISPSQPPPVRPVRPAERVPIRKLRDIYANDYRRAQQDGQIEIRPIETYQGRVRTSTNGCTVISPLVVAHHLRNSAGGVLDSEIVDVIDKECGPLLREIRSKLGLEGDSLIIPSDVHDHLVDRKILQQNKFFGATGGNILDREHLMEFLKLLQAEEKGAFAKAGACLFFHEHVVSLVKMPIGRGMVVYDLVDSMPSQSHGGRATRTRCRDVATLEVLLKWYSTRKFSESECSYIDRNEWDENMADFDPRVFQSFVWTE